jgi:cobalamin biosynthetic protein CobC
MLEHGGNLALAAAQYKIPLPNWLDLSTGLNPDGYPLPAIAAEVWQRLPLDDDGLIEAACTYYNCNNALAAAGSQALLQVLPRLRPAGKVALLSPMYQEHGHAWQRHGHELIAFSGEPPAEILQQADVVILCNPNNPTGARFTSADLLRWHAELAAHGGWLIVDEAFMDATPEYSIAQHTQLQGLLVLRSLGKFFGLAGARVGFLLAKPQLLQRVQAEIGPWPVTGASRLIAKQVFSDTVWQQQARLQLANSSARLATLLQQNGLSPHGGTLLFQYVLTTQARAWQQHLARHGIWVRLFAEDDVPLALRFGLPPASGWEKLAQALNSFSDSQN